MSPTRPAPTLALLGLLSIALTGCGGGHSDAPAPDKVQAAVQRLGGTPQDTFQETVVVKSPDEAHYRPQTITLVPSTSGNAFHIIDAEGDVYDDYDDYLVNNTLTR